MAPYGRINVPVTPPLKALQTHSTRLDFCECGDEDASRGVLWLAPDYIAPQSTHSTGQTVDTTLIRARGPKKAPANCAFSDPNESVDMGTAFDCFDPKANTESPLAAPDQTKARAVLKAIMAEAGFRRLWRRMVALLLPGREGQGPVRFPHRAEPLSLRCC